YIRSPDHGADWFRRQHEVAVSLADGAPELLLEVGEEAFGSQIASKRGHAISHRFKKSHTGYVIPHRTLKAIFPRHLRRAWRRVPLARFCRQLAADRGHVLVLDDPEAALSGQRAHCFGSGASGAVPRGDA